MIVVEHEHVELDYSPDCSGVWFDAGEVELLLETMQMESTGIWRSFAGYCGRQFNSRSVGSLSLMLVDANSGRRLWIGFARAEIQVGRTLAELGAAYLEWAKGYYRKNGIPTTQVDKIQRHLKALLQCHRSALVDDFGPNALRGVQKRLVAERRREQVVQWYFFFQLVQLVDHFGRRAVDEQAILGDQMGCRQAFE